MKKKMTPLEKSKTFQELCQPCTSVLADGVQVMASLMSRSDNINHDMNKIISRTLGNAGLLETKEERDKILALSDKFCHMIYHETKPRKEWSAKGWGLLEIALAFIRMAETADAIDHLPEE